MQIPEGFRDQLVGFWRVKVLGVGLGLLGSTRVTCRSAPLCGALGILMHLARGHLPHSIPFGGDCPFVV